MAITRAPTALDHLKDERERIERQRRAAQAAMQAGAGWRRRRG